MSKSELGHHRRAAATERLREIIFGAGHGLVSLIGLTTGLAAGSTPPKTIVLAGLVSLFTGATTLFSQQYLAAKSQREVWEHWLTRERDEFKRYPNEEREEMDLYYSERGFNAEERRMILDRLTKNIDVWLEAHAVHVLKFIPPEPDYPTLAALYMTGFHVLGAFIPIFPYLILPVANATVVSLGMTLAALFAIGAAKARVTGRKWLNSGAEMLVVASSAALIGFIVGTVLSR